MTDTVALTALLDAMAWCQQVNATLRFFDDPEGAKVRVSVRDTRDPDEFTFALIPVADSTPQSLAISLTTAREQIEPQIRRQLIRVV